MSTGDTQTLFSAVIDGGTVSPTNSLNLGLLLSLTTEAAYTTSVLFTCTYGDVVAGTISTDLHDGTTGMTEGTAIWLNFQIEGTSLSDQLTAASKYGDEIDSENVLTSVSNTLSIDVSIDQTMEILGVFSGDLSTVITREYAILKQLEYEEE